MKYVAHRSTTHAAWEFIWLISESGISGYGAWWILVEMICLWMKNGNSPSIDYPIKKLARVLGKNTRSLLKFLSMLTKLSLIQYRIYGKDDEMVEITLRNPHRYILFVDLDDEFPIGIVEIEED